MVCNISFSLTHTLISFLAGSLLLARNGICLLRDIGQWKKDDREQLQHSKSSINLPIQLSVCPFTL